MKINMYFYKKMHKNMLLSIAILIMVMLCFSSCESYNNDDWINEIESDFSVSSVENVNTELDYESDISVVENTTTAENKDTELTISLDNYDDCLVTEDTSCISFVDQDVTVTDNELYVNIEELIDIYMGKYLSKNCDDNIVNSKNEEIWGYSTEGGIMAEFRDDNNQLLRYRMNIYKETGSSEWNYYIISDDNIYLTCLDKTYDDYLLTRSRGDVLYYSFIEYWVDNDTAYYIDRLNNKLIECQESPIPDFFYDYIANEE
ncbi:MAG: hypothetical protein NC120_12155 [Ruminococcus sp.]|nr:hypothetical protein [Ruminococcus sp.]